MINPKHHGTHPGKGSHHGREEPPGSEPPSAPGADAGEQDHLPERRNKRRLFESWLHASKPKAFEEWLRHSLPDRLRFAKWRLRGELNPEVDAEDDVQEGFLRWWGHPGEFAAKAARYPDIQSESKLAEVVWDASAKSAATARVRGRGRRSWREEKAGEASNTSRNEGIYDASQALERNERLSMIHDAMSQLPERERAVAGCIHLDGLTYPETAKRLNIPLGTVKSRLRRANQRLQEALKSYID